MITKGMYVHIGKSSLVWQVHSLTETDAVLLSATRKLDGSGFERARYIPGRVSRKVVPVSKLKNAEA